MIAGWDWERAAWQEGHRTVAGIDEAGRGALAGPVVAACVILPCAGIDFALADSKTLSPDRRETLHEQIQQRARGVGIGVVDAPRIDAINILQATHEAMRLALAALPPGLFPTLALIDGLPVRPFPLDQWAIVRGDGSSVSIAAASIVAKVHRDRLMRQFHAQYPVYGFAGHKGYGAATHLQALHTHGPCPLHRRSYRPVRDAEEARRADPSPNVSQPSQLWECRAKRCVRPTWSVWAGRFWPATFAVHRENSISSPVNRPNRSRPWYSWR